MCVSSKQIYTNVSFTLVHYETLKTIPPSLYSSTSPRPMSISIVQAHLPKVLQKWMVYVSPTVDFPWREVKNHHLSTVTNRGFVKISMFAHEIPKWLFVKSNPQNRDDICIKTLIIHTYIPFSPNSRLKPFFLKSKVAAIWG